jgi:putative membrane protein
MPALSVLIWLASAGGAFAHGDAPHGESVPWTFDPWIVAPLAVIGALFVAGTARLARRSTTGRTVRLRQALVYAAGWLALAGALVSPLHWLGEHLFTFHMIEHEIVMAIAAPLLVLARPVATMLWGLPRTLRRVAAGLMRRRGSRALWRGLTRPGTATLLHGAAIWLWHAPPLFDWAVTSEAAHRWQHLSFFLTALLFWWAVLVRAEAGVAVWHLFVTMLHTAVLGALMALAPRVLYTAQTASAAQWGLTPLEDQQLAGVLMWVPAGTVYAGAALAMLARWIRRSSQSAGGYHAAQTS